MREVKRLVVASARGVRRTESGAVQVRCVHCDTWKTLGNFGLRYMQPTDELRSQSWCYECRAQGMAEHD